MKSRTMMRAKIHRIRVTQCELEYEGSLTLDPELMQAADMVPYERVDIFDIDNGNRFATYLIEGRPGSGDCCLNGAAARQVAVGDKLILVSYVTLDDEQASRHQPTVVLVDESNRIKALKAHETAGTRVV